MAEKKETAKTEKPEKPKKEAKKAAPKLEPKAEKAEAAPEPDKSGPDNKKINRLTLAEIETKLEEIKATMGGHKSKYARHLLLRKKILSP